MSLQWFDWLGLAGVMFVLLAFFLLQAGKLSGDAIGYQLANLFGALFILFSILGSPAQLSDVISPLVMQLAWLAISLYGLGRGLRLRWTALREKRGGR
ncbi:MAG TPA: hypothetical protein VFY12_06700 [Arenimonas sp.]|nr:hypothetical protein [Arenimonas sp.]